MRSHDDNYRYGSCSKMRSLIVLVTFINQLFLSHGHTPLGYPPSFGITRGGSLAPADTNKNDNEVNPFYELAEFLADKIPEASSIDQITKTLERMAAAQQTFKGLDGAAHEAYQRTRSGDEIDTSVTGRAQRSAARLAATAEALLACELIEMIEVPALIGEEGIGSREVLLNQTFSDTTIKLGDSCNLAVLVLYEPGYDGGAGLEHGSIVSLASTDQGNRNRALRGRILVVLADDMAGDIGSVLSILRTKPKRIKLASGLVTDEVASVQPILYNAAGDVLKLVEPHLRKYNTTAVHFMGRSLAGGVASLAATIFDGSIPLPTKTKVKTKTKHKEKKPMDSPRSPREDQNTTAQGAVRDPEILPLSGLGRARASAITLGAPPCLSSNVLAAFCTSFLYGDDLVVRATSDSFDRLCERMQRYMKGGFLGRNVGWMSDTLSLTISSLQSHAHGSEGEEANLSVPGKAYLIRPRRLGGLCSIHEVGNLNKGGREALRANLLWQLHDILLSKSMWRHHQLTSYIHGLDRVQLRGTTEVEQETMY